MKTLFSSGVCVALLVLPLSAVSDEGYREGVQAYVLTKTDKTLDNTPIQYPVSDHAEVTVKKIIMPPGTATGWHKHPVPSFGYVVSGELEITLDRGEVYRFKKGDAIVETIDRVHQGYNPGTEDSEIVVFYTGAEGVPTAVKASEPEITSGQ